jgi:hypothetical protein
LRKLSGLRREEPVAEFQAAFRVSIATGVPQADSAGTRRLKRGCISSLGAGELPALKRNSSGSGIRKTQQIVDFTARIGGLMQVA